MPLIRIHNKTRTLQGHLSLLYCTCTSRTASSLRQSLDFRRWFFLYYFFFFRRWRWNVGLFSTLLAPCFYAFLVLILLNFSIVIFRWILTCIFLGHRIINGSHVSTVAIICLNGINGCKSLRNVYILGSLSVVLVDVIRCAGTASSVIGHCLKIN